MQLTNRILGVAVTLVGAGMLILAMRLPAPVTGAHITYGPAFFPALIGLAVLVSGVIIVVFPATAQDDPVVGEVAEDRSIRGGGLLIVVTGSVAYICLSDVVGFVPLAAAILTCLLAYGSMALRRAIPLGIAGSLIIYVTFAKGLLVPLPRGLLQSLSAWL
jgi:putative tricarboxylic transport membrane protein